MLTEFDEAGRLPVVLVNPLSSSKVKVQSIVVQIRSVEGHELICAGGIEEAGVVNGAFVYVLADMSIDRVKGRACTPCLTCLAIEQATPA